jgi:enterochelin esterase-like enzyme/sugar lactone lactonase YvrE
MWKFVIGFVSVMGLWAADEYVLGPDSQKQPGVPAGVVTKYSWTSKIYPGSTRDYWVYVPAQYKAEKPACVMIFQDGGGFVNETGAWRTPTVFDNLIHKGEMPVTIAVFLNPGVMPPLSPETQQGRYNRSYEYDALGDRYARFLLEEILPEVGKLYTLSKNPDDYALAGLSSGGIASFNAAWNRPEAFHRVMSFIGSYTNLRGGDTIAAMIRKSEPKPLRVFLQDGRADQDIYSGNWFLANQTIYSALQYAGYESEFVIGTEAHNPKHGGAILPDALRWVWKDYPKPVGKSTKMNERGVYTILEPGKEWELLGKGFQLTADSAVDKEGNVFFTDHHNQRIMKVDLAGKISVWKQDAGGAHGIVFGPDGRLYAGQHDKKRIVAFSPDGTESVIAEGIQTHHLTVTARNDIYFAVAPNHQVWVSDGKGNKRVVFEGIDWPRGVQMSTDQSLLVVNDPHTRWVWSFEILGDGSLANGEKFFHLETPDDSSESDAGGMAFDTEGFLYVATNLGVQVCDAAGRVNTIIGLPSGTGGASGVFFGGPERRWLYVTDGEKLFRRQVKRRGAESWNATKPPAPRL